MTKFLTLAAAAAALTATPAFAGNLIVDGGFDAGTGRGFGPAWGIITTDNSQPDSVLRVQGQDYSVCCGAPGSDAARANFFATFGSGQTSNEVGLFQEFTARAGSHQLSFDAGAFGGAQTITFGIFSYATNTYVYTNSFSPTPTTDLDALFQNFNGRVVLGAGDYALAFTNFPSETINVDGMIDNVSLSAVPEPATWALMILGFGAVGGAMRRRQAKVNVRFA